MAFTNFFVGIDICISVWRLEEGCGFIILFCTFSYKYFNKYIFKKL